MERVGLIVRRRRETLGLTLSEVAKAAGVAKSYLSMIENGRVANPPSRPVLGQLERALGLVEGELLRVAAWERAPREVRSQLAGVAEAARQGRELATWIKEQATQRHDGVGRDLDTLYRSGQLGRRVERVLLAAGATLPEDEHASGDGSGNGNGEAKGRAVVPDVRLRRVPVINKVAAGYPSGFTDLDYPARVADEYLSVPNLEDPDAFGATVVGASMEPAYREGDVVVFSPLAEVTDGSDCFVRLEPDHETTFKRVYFEAEGEVRLQPLNPAFASATYPREEVAGLYRAVWKCSRL